ncbi:MAG: hypothetical protein OEZ20_06760 [candidate division WOR-3 bacterium]|nr:hypothetical protein [candidate division WOR-3 bacterium]
MKHWIFFTLVITIFNESLAYSPVIVPQWSYQPNSLPRQAILYDIENDRLAEIAIAQEPNQLVVLANTGDSILWTFQTPTKINQLAVIRGQLPTSILIVAASPYLLAIDGQGKLIWNLTLPGLINQTIKNLAIGNFTPDPGDEIVVVTEKSILVVLPTGKFVRSIILPFQPKQVEIGNVDTDPYKEIVISNYLNLIVYRAEGDVELKLDLAQTAYEINHGIEVYDFNFDQIQEIVAITKKKQEVTEDEIESWVSCFSVNGKVLWQSHEKAGSPRAITVIRGEIYTCGQNDLGQDYLVKRDRSGKILKTVYLTNESYTQLLYSPQARLNINQIEFQVLHSLGHLLLVGLGWQADYESPIITSLRIFSPFLEEINLSSPEYFSNSRIITSDRNQHLLSLRIGLIDSDTLSDILLVREQKPGRYKIDCLINRIGTLYRAERDLWANYRTSLDIGNKVYSERLRHRAMSLAEGFGAKEVAVRTERFIIGEWRHRTGVILIRSILIAILIVAMVVGFGIIVIRPIIKRRIWRQAQVEYKSVPTLVGVATDIIALDHNYVVKGNLGGAYNRLKEIMNKYGLNSDRDLAIFMQRKVTYDSTAITEFSKKDFLISYYRFVKRLTKESRIVNFVELIKKICYNVVGENYQIQEFSMNRNEYFPDRISGGIKPPTKNLSISFVYLINRDFPDIYNTARLYWDSRLYNWFEHLCTDHLRYSQNCAQFVFDYESATEWNRKLVLHLISDSKESIKFNQKDSHLLSRFEELREDYQDYIMRPENENYLYFPNEKIWVKIFDLVSILLSILEHGQTTKG